MKIRLLIVLVLCVWNCKNTQSDSLREEIIGSWEMVYAEIYENDSLKIKDLSKSNFIKIINKSHFSFFNQDHIANKSYGGAGTFILKGHKYIETLTFTSAEAIKNHKFPFTVKIKGDTLIQSGLEEVKKAGIKREIIEKYIKIN